MTKYFMYVYENYALTKNNRQEKNLFSRLHLNTSVAVPQIL